VQSAASKVRCGVKFASSRTQDKRKPILPREYKRAADTFLGSDRECPSFVRDFPLAEERKREKERERERERERDPFRSLHSASDSQFAIGLERKAAAQERDGHPSEREKAQGEEEVSVSFILAAVRMECPVAVTYGTSVSPCCSRSASRCTATSRTFNHVT